MGLENGVKPVIIVGAGPAGLACAWRLAQFGIPSLLLERKDFPRDKVCGDALSGKVVALLRKLGGTDLIEDLRRQPFAHPVEYLDFIGQRAARVRLHFPPKDSYPQGFVIPRREFDTWLVKNLPSSVELITSAFVQKVERIGKLWRVHTRDKRVFEGRFLVGADGTASRVAPWVWAYHELNRPLVYPAVRGYQNGEKLEGLELYFVAPYLPGYLWKFPIYGGASNVGIGLPPSTLKRAGLSLRTHLQALFPKLRAVEGHGIPISLHDRPLSAPGCALVGDAAALADPFTGEGIGNALLSGIRLAEALARTPPTQWADADWETLYTRPLYAELHRELRLTRWLHRLARYQWSVETTLRLARALPALTNALLRWYGAKDTD